MSIKKLLSELLKRIPLHKKELKIINRIKQDRKRRNKNTIF